jgi:hypothetical protein
MKKSKNKCFQIFIILILFLVGVSYFFNYKEGADPCHKVKVEDDFCNKRSDCRVLKGRCKTPGPPAGRFRIPTCSEYNPSTCIDK